MYPSLHLSFTTRAGGDRGGVPKFAWYLQRAIGCDILTPSQVGGLDWNKYKVLVADGTMTDHFPHNFKGLKISVVHGTWAEFGLRNKTKAFEGEAESQGRVWNQSDVLTVAVSQSAADMVLKHHKAEVDAIIPNGIDLSAYVPRLNSNVKPVLLHAATDYNKDALGKLNEIARLLPEFDCQFLGAKIGEEPNKFARGDIFLSCSHCEGYSYATVEAMSCGLPIVTSSTGIFEDMDPRGVGHVVAWDAPAEQFSAAVRTVWNNRSTYKPREWVEQHGSFELFASRWNAFIEKKLGELK